MPARAWIAALATALALVAHAAPAGADGGAGAGTQPAPARTQTGPPAPGPTPDHQAGDQAGAELGAVQPEVPTTAAPAGQAVPDAGVDVLPLAAAAAALLVAGLALRRRPHARR